MLARYYLLPTIGRLYLCMVESEYLSHDYSAIYSAYSSLACATTRLMVRVCVQLVLWEYQQVIQIGEEDWEKRTGWGWGNFTTKQRAEKCHPETVKCPYVLLIAILCGDDNVKFR